MMSKSAQTKSKMTVAAMLLAMASMYVQSNGGSSLARVACQEDFASVRGWTVRFVVAGMLAHPGVYDSLYHHLQLPRHAAALVGRMKMSTAIVI